MAIRISASVGKSCKNKPDDVKQTQEQINQHAKDIGCGKLKVDGMYGKKTDAAIKGFQKKCIAGKVDGVINAKGPTWSGLSCKAGKIPKPDDEEKNKAGGKAKGGDDEEEDEEEGDLNNPTLKRKIIKKIVRKPYKFAFLVSTKVEDCQLIFKRKGDSKVFGQALKKKTKKQKITWGTAQADPNDKQTLLLCIEGKQLGQMEKMGKKLLKREKLMPFKKIRLMVDGAPVGDIADEAMEEEEAQPAVPGKDPGKGKDKKLQQFQAKIIKTPQLWRTARRDITGSLNQLKDAVRKSFASEGKQVIADIEKKMKALDGVVRKLDDRLAKTLDKAGSAKDKGAFETEIKNAKDVINEYATFVKSDPIIAHIDANPFGVKTDLNKKLGASLKQVHKAIGDASKAA